MARQIPYDVAEPRTIRSGPKSLRGELPSFTRKRAYADNV